jgi:hypothetical protein
MTPAAAGIGKKAMLYALEKFMEKESLMAATLRATIAALLLAVPVFTAFTRFVKSEVEKWGKVVRAIGAKAD